MLACPHCPLQGSSRPSLLVFSLTQSNHLEGCKDHFQAIQHLVSPLACQDCMFTNRNKPTYFHCISYYCGSEIIPYGCSLATALYGLDLELAGVSGESPSDFSELWNRLVYLSKQELEKDICGMLSLILLVKMSLLITFTTQLFVPPYLRVLTWWWQLLNVTSWHNWCLVLLSLWGALLHLSLLLSNT